MSDFLNAVNNIAQAEKAVGYSEGLFLGTLAGIYVTLLTILFILAVVPV